jgi:hypothetical protein
MRLRVIKYFIKYLVIFLERISPFYFTVVLKSKKLSENNNITLSNQLGKNFGILMQGPIVSKDNFTLETLKIYRLKYPNIQIILSTSEDESLENLNFLRSNGFHVETYIEPSYKGISNINRQITSVTNGLKYLKENNCDYVLKTRTDQRIYKDVDFLSYMVMLQDLFPLTAERDLILEKRLVIASLNSYRTRLYPVSDMFMFGKIEDLTFYWNIPLDIKTDYNKKPDDRLFMEYSVCEGYLLNNFSKNINYDLLWTENDSDQFLKKYFTIVDQEQLDLFWFKYDRFIDSPFFYQPQILKHRIRLDFIDWLSFKN